MSTQAHLLSFKMIQITHRVEIRTSVQFILFDISISSSSLFLLHIILIYYPCLFFLLTAVCSKRSGGHLKLESLIEIYILKGFKAAVKQEMNVLEGGACKNRMRNITFQN